jgi:hypothetical protein
MMDDITAENLAKGKKPATGEKPSTGDQQRSMPTLEGRGAEDGPVIHDIAKPDEQEGHWAVMPEDIDWTEWSQDEKVDSSSTLY